MADIVDDRLGLVQSTGRHPPMDAWQTTGAESDRTADDEAVLAAEKTVGEAWMARLLLTESETEAVLGACARARRRAGDRVQAARRAGDLATLVRSQTDLESADSAWDRAWEAHERAQGDLARELALWSRGLARRVHLNRADQSSAGHR